MTICSVWNRLRFALAASAVLLLVGCNAGTPAPTAAPSPFPDAQPGSDWIPAVAQGWPDQPGFSLMLPPGWALNELQGIDSYVGENYRRRSETDVRLREVWLEPDPGG